MSHTFRARVSFGRSTNEGEEHRDMFHSESSSASSYYLASHVEAIGFSARCVDRGESAFAQQTGDFVVLDERRRRFRMGIDNGARLTRTLIVSSEPIACERSACQEKVDSLCEKEKECNEDAREKKDVTSQCRSRVRARTKTVARSSRRPKITRKRTPMRLVDFAEADATRCP